MHHSVRWSFPQRFTSKAPQTPSALLLAQPPRGQMLSADSRGRASTLSGPAKIQWLPASVPARVCSCLHDDLDPVLLSGAWHSECSQRRMQRSHTTDALLSAGCSAPPRYSLKACQTAQTMMMRVPLSRFFFCSFHLVWVFFFFLVTTCPSCLLGHPTGSYLFQPPLSTCSSCLRVTGCFCLYPAAGHELIMRTQGFSVSITKLWHHHITHTHKQTHI